MSISTEIEAMVARYYHVEKWRVGTIAKQLGIHHSTVKRVLSQLGVAKAKLSRPSKIDPYLPFILEILNSYPKLTASRLYGMVVERGYDGSPDHFRHMIALHRPRPSAEAYLRLRTLAGEQGQVDWGHFGYIMIGQAKRSLMAFVMVLSFSRKIFLKFYLSQQTENFLRGHEGAFESFGGVPRVLLYDNLKAATLERQGEAIRFNPNLLKFAAHYRFEARPVAVARGNEKGRVERAIRYIRENFFAGRNYKDLDDLNAQAQLWCDGVASNRPCPEDKTKSVHEVFLEEQPQLLALPDNPYPTQEQTAVHVGKTPYVRFDLNDYSVPYTLTRCTLTVLATLDEVTILDGNKIVAKHLRSFDKGQQIEDETHIKELSDRKKEASQHRGQNRLTRVVPCGAELLKQAAARGYHLTAIVKRLIQLLDDYGAAELEVAIKEALARDVPHPNAVQLSLEKRREERHQPPPVQLKLDKRVRELRIRPHNLNNYDLEDKND